MNNALVGSIHKWAMIAYFGGKDKGPRNCPLCEKYFSKDCEGCPISVKTGENCCGGTPYKKWIDLQLPSPRGFYTTETKELKEVAKKELYFLCDLYLELNPREDRFKVGDTVRVSNKVHSFYKKDKYAIMPSMTKFVGKIATIESVTKSGWWLTLNIDKYNWHYATLEKVTEETKYRGVEYKIVEEDVDDLTEYLNKLGERGWELISYTNSYVPKLIFKRFKGE